MAGPWNNSSTAASNTTIGGTGIAGSNAPSNFDDGLRETIAQVRRSWEDFGAASTVAGTADAITLALNSGSPSSYQDGMAFMFIAGSDNTATSVTLNIDSVGAEPIKKAEEDDGTEIALAVGDIQAGGLYMVVWRSTWDSSNGAWQLVDLNHTSAAEVIAFLAGATLTGALTLGGTLNGADNELNRVDLKDYGEKVNAIGSIGGGTQDIDIESGNVVTGTVDTSTTTFTFSNPTASGDACSFTLILTNGGSQTVNWPASVDWAGGTAPTLTTSGVDVLEFLTVDGGTTWLGFPAGLDMS